MRFLDLWPKVRSDVWMAAILSVLIYAWIDTRTSVSDIKNLVGTRSEWRGETTRVLRRILDRVEIIEEKQREVEARLGR